jgi:hypothetical protein
LEIGKEMMGPVRRKSSLRAGTMTAKIGSAMPLVGNVTHQQGTVKVDRAFGEVRLVLEEAGVDFVDFQRLDVPTPACAHQSQ